MLRIYTLSALLFLCITGVAQTPNKFNYQAVARNSQGQYIPNANINLRLTILSGSATGTPVYSETRKVTTNNAGLFSVVIGSPGATSTTGSITAIDWSTGNMYLKVEADPIGGTNFVAMGSTELVSVPYALYAVNGRKGDPGATGPQGPVGPQGPQGPAGTIALPYAASQSLGTTPLFSLTNTAPTDNATSIKGVSASVFSGPDAFSGATAIWGELTATSGGVYSAALRGINRSTNAFGMGVLGYHAGIGAGIQGESFAGSGVNGYSNAGIGVSGHSSTGYGGYFTSSPSSLALVTGTGHVLITKTLTAGSPSPAFPGNGVNAFSTNAWGIYASSTAAGGAGIVADGRYIGIQAAAAGADPNRQALRGENFGSATGWAGVFVGNVGVFGTLSKTAGSFQIDHPLDPENKFLVHSFVESPDMKNIYDGVVTTNASGEAIVTMPEWFEALNMDFRYQLTCINQFAQAIVLREMSGNKFTIKTDKPNVKVSWQVTGTRNDPYAQKNRLPVEKMKNEGEKGKYIYPEGYGKGRESAIDAIRVGAVRKE